jgi:hypothetical protein
MSTKRMSELIALEFCNQRHAQYSILINQQTIEPKEYR